jgi:hypothetical protein
VFFVIVAPSFGRKLNSWRFHPALRPSSIKDVVPGLGTASVLFAAYCGVEWLMKPAESHHEHESHNGHGEKHH